MGTLDILIELERYGILDLRRHKQRYVFVIPWNMLIVPLPKELWIALEQQRDTLLPQLRPIGPIRHPETNWFIF